MEKHEFLQLADKFYEPANDIVSAYKTHKKAAKAAKKDFDDKVKEPLDKLVVLIKGLLPGKKVDASKHHANQDQFRSKVKNAS